MPPNGTGVAITNPLVLYRSLVATNRIAPDPSQHRLALHLQQLYEKLKDYEPSIEYSRRIQQLSRAVSASADDVSSGQEQRIIGTRGIWTSLLAQKEKRDSLALTRVLTSHEAAMNLQSPKGLMLHGEVGTGKSMLIDLFADCLPNRKKRRYHFNTFMLDTISRLEALRKSRLVTAQGAQQDEYSLLWLARDLIQSSPILFLDEFQLPDRAASKILSNLMTSFFQLGGVLIATSNRMPEELAKAAGMEFTRPVSRLSRLGWSLGFTGVVGRDNGPGQKGEFAQFLEVMRARCDVWEMEGKQDYRRLSGEEDHVDGDNRVHPVVPEASLERAAGFTTSSLSTSDQDTAPISASGDRLALPKHYLVQPPADADPSSISAFTATLDTLLSTSSSVPSPVSWTPSTLTVYGRSIPIPRQYGGVAYFNFPELCGSVLGPADYITLASTYHTIVLTDVPTLTFLQKNEARRLITLLDALYEARCRLLMAAAAGPDDIFFPEPTQTSKDSSTSSTDDLIDDAVYPETYSEIHQDLTSPFRPNVSSYSTSLAADALEDDPPNRTRRPGSSFTEERRLDDENAKAPDFANVGGLTGEDERFAVKRARSRIWEMCSGKWWARQGQVEDWWRPLPIESRHWEHGSPVLGKTEEPDQVDITNVETLTEDPVASQQDIFAHGASPFRTVSDAPPKIQWTHVWGTVKWGKKAGAWGKGVEGLEDRKKERDGLRDEDSSEK